MKIEWKDEYSVGIKEIDDQHKYFISLLNDLYNAIVAGKSREDLKELFLYLADYAEKHFATEEKYFDEFNYDGAAEHKAKHQEMRLEIEKIKNMDDEEKEIDFYGNIVYLLKNWLEEHLAQMDQKYKKCFAQHGLK
jgi:hemerythrin